MKISDIYTLVKEYDKDFKPSAPAALDDVKAAVKYSGQESYDQRVYHGTRHLQSVMFDNSSFCILHS